MKAIDRYSLVVHFNRCAVLGGSRKVWPVFSSSLNWCCSLLTFCKWNWINHFGVVLNWPHYESEVWCIAFISTHSHAKKTNFHMKSFARSLAFLMRFNATRNLVIGQPREIYELLSFFRDEMWWKSNLHVWSHYITKLSRPLSQWNRMCLAHTMPGGSWSAHAHTKHFNTTDQWLFGPSDHARERQCIL